MEEKKILRPKKYEGMSIFRPPLCYELVGRSFDLYMDDGFDCKLHFIDRKMLKMSILDGEAKTCSYDCLKADDTTYFVNFEVTDAPVHTGKTIILDTENMLATIAEASLGHNPRYPRMTKIDFSFGAIRREDGTLNEIRHGYTTDIVGKAVNWNYGLFEIVHVYSSERYYRVAFSPKRLSRMAKEFPDRPPMDFSKMPVYEDDAAYIKIKDQLYLVSLSERILCQKNGHGNSLLFTMNFKTLRDVGRSFGTNSEWQDENYTLGACGEFFDASDHLARKSTYYIR